MKIKSIGNAVLFHIVIIRENRKMYIEPAEYLDLTDRLTVFARKYDEACNEKTSLANKCVSLQEKVRMLESRVAQLELDKQKQREGLKQHVTTKAEQIIHKIHSTKAEQKAVIEQEVSKLRNWSAINTLQKLEERITENRTVTFQKDFYQKVKTLYLIDKKKLGCTSSELFDWVRELAYFKKNTNVDNQNVSLMAGTQKSMKKSASRNTKQKQNGKRYSKMSEKQNKADRQELKIKEEPSNKQNQNLRQLNTNEIPTIKISRPSTEKPQLTKSKKQMQLDDPLNDILSDII